MVEPAEPGDLQAEDSGGRGVTQSAFPGSTQGHPGDRHPRAGEQVSLLSLLVVLGRPMDWGCCPFRQSP